MIGYAVHSILEVMAKMTINKILIVEDDRNLLDTLKYNLRKEGYEVVTAIDGAEALDVARREKTELIVLDIILPYRLQAMTRIG